MKEKPKGLSCSNEPAPHVTCKDLPAIETMMPAVVGSGIGRIGTIGYIDHGKTTLAAAPPNVLLIDDLVSMKTKESIQLLGTMRADLFRPTPSSNRRSRRKAERKAKKKKR